METNLLLTIWVTQMPKFLITCSYEKNLVAEIDLEADELESDSSGIISGDLEDELIDLDENEEISWVQVGETSFEYTGREI